MAYDILPIAILLYKYCAYSVLAGIGVHLYGQFGIEEPKNGRAGKVALELLEGCLAFVAAIPRFICFCECSEGARDGREILDESPVIVAETQEAVDLLHVLGNSNLQNCRDVVWIWFKMMCPK